MRIGVPKETAADEHRVALVPEVVSKLKAKGLDVLVQSGAGSDALLSDSAFADAGAQISADAGEIWGSDVVVTIAPPDAEQIRALGRGSVLIGFLAPLGADDARAYWTATIEDVVAAAEVEWESRRFSKARLAEADPES